jgi:hypothetical protein
MNILPFAVAGETVRAPDSRRKEQPNHSQSAGDRSQTKQDDQVHRHLFESESRQGTFAAQAELFVTGRLSTHHCQLVAVGVGEKMPRAKPILRQTQLRQSKSSPHKPTVFEPNANQPCIENGLCKSPAAAADTNSRTGHCSRLNTAINCGQTTFALNWLACWCPASSAAHLCSPSEPTICRVASARHQASLDSCGEPTSLEL